jgi:hypothetical protein
MQLATDRAFAAPRSSINEPHTFPQSYVANRGVVVLSLSTARAQEGLEITAVARLGDTVLAPATLMDASEPRLNDNGAILFKGDRGLLLASPNGHIVVAAPGDRAPDGRLIAEIGAASINAFGQVAFVASLLPSGSALFLFSEGTTTAIAESNEPAGLYRFSCDLRP